MSPATQITTSSIDPRASRRSVRAAFAVTVGAVLALAGAGTAEAAHSGGWYAWLDGYGTN